MKKRGFTLVELVLVIVVAGIAIPGTMLLFNELARRSVYDEAMDTATVLAEGELERVVQKSFANVVDENRGSPVSFGGNFAAYVWQIIVDYVQSDLSTVSATATQYKRVESRVTNTVIGDVSMQTVVTDN